MNKLYFGLAVAIGVLIIFLGAKALISKWRLIQEGVQAEATVTDFTVRSNRGTYYAPVLSFVLPDGEGIIVDTKDFSSQGTFQKGQKVSVVYLLTDPHQASIIDFKSLWMMPILILVLGCIIIGIAFIIK